MNRFDARGPMPEWPRTRAGRTMAVATDIRQFEGWMDQCRESMDDDGTRPAQNSMHQEHWSMLESGWT